MQLASNTLRMVAKATAADLKAAASAADPDLWGVWGSSRMPVERACQLSAGACIGNRRPRCHEEHLPEPCGGLPDVASNPGERAYIEDRGRSSDKGQPSEASGVSAAPRAYCENGSDGGAEQLLPSAGGASALGNVTLAQFDNCRACYMRAIQQKPNTKHIDGCKFRSRQYACRKR